MLHGVSKCLQNSTAVKKISFFFEDDLRLRHTVQVLVNAFLALSDGGLKLCTLLFDTVQEKLLHTQRTEKSMSLDWHLVDRLVDTMEAAKKDTGPHGTTLVDVLCAAVAPPGQGGSPKRAKDGPHHQSLVTIANRLGVGVHRMC